MMRSEFCKDCRHAEKFGADRFRCHLDPPRHAVHDGINAGWTWPMVKATDWCGQFAAHKFTREVARLPEPDSSSAPSDVEAWTE